MTDHYGQLIPNGPLHPSLERFDMTNPYDTTPPPPPQVVYVQAPKKRHGFLKFLAFCLVAFVLLIVVIVVAAANGSKSPATVTPGGGSLEHSEDVAITGCLKDDMGDVGAQVTITNHSSKASDYIVTVAFDTPDGKTQIDTGTAVINNLQPGQSSIQQATSFTAAPAAYKCRVSDITRFAGGS